MEVGVLGMGVVGDGWRWMLWGMGGGGCCGGWVEVGVGCCGGWVEVGVVGNGWRWVLGVVGDGVEVGVVECVINSESECSFCGSNTLCFPSYDPL